MCKADWGLVGVVFFFFFYLGFLIVENAVKAFKTSLQLRAGGIKQSPSVLMGGKLQR